MTKRPIDTQRDSAKFGIIGVEGDDSRVTEVFAIDGKLHIIKERGIYAHQLADEIDPKRSNSSIPDTQQRVLEIGSDHPIVAKVLLTAKTLFNENYFGVEFGQERAIKLALELTCDIAAIESMRSEFEALESRAADFVSNNKSKGGSFALPSIGNVKARFDAFTQKAGHVVNTLEKIAQLFYPAELKSKWIDNLISLTVSRYGKDDPFSLFISEVGPKLLNLLLIRNAVEHETNKNYARVKDFHFLESGQISCPTVDILLNGEGPHHNHIHALMEAITETLPETVELFFAFICDKNVGGFSGTKLFVQEFTPQGGNKHQRFYYATMMGEQIVRFG